TFVQISFRFLYFNHYFSMLLVLVFLPKTVLNLYDFFFQAEDGIRDFHVTGVQTCALPILKPEAQPMRYLNCLRNKGKMALLPIQVAIMRRPWLGLLPKRGSNPISSCPPMPLKIGRAPCRESVWSSLRTLSLYRSILTLQVG